MGENSNIQWTTHTASFWEGCAKVSDGCKHCYAETRNARFHAKADGGATHWGVDAPRLMRSESYWKQPLKWNKEAKASGVRQRVFCASLSDVFEDRPDLIEPRARLFRLIEECDWLDWQLLTKRPENMMRLAKVWGDKWPDNVWAGCTVENQEAAEKRILWLCEVPAVVRFLSCEPLLERVDLRNVDMKPILKLDRDPSPHAPMCMLDALTGHMKGPDDMMDFKIHWVIVGGESGKDARPFHLQWARRIVADCKATGAAVFVKQLGANARDGVGSYDWHVNVVCRDSHGGDWSEDAWPQELRVREFPIVRAR